jgi:hypothetical protein
MSAGVGRTAAGRQKNGREKKLLRGACVQTTFRAEQTKLWPLFDFPSEFTRTAAVSSDAVATATRVGEWRNACRILVGKPEREA